MTSPDPNDPLVVDPCFDGVQLVPVMLKTSMLRQATQWGFLREDGHHVLARVDDLAEDQLRGLLFWLYQHAALMQDAEAGLLVDQHARGHLTDFQLDVALRPLQRVSAIEWLRSTTLVRRLEQLHPPGVVMFAPPVAEPRWWSRLRWWR